MATVIYGDKALIPAPFVSFRKIFNRTPDGKLVGAGWAGTIQGTIVSFKGSPNSSQVFWTLSGYPADESLTGTRHFEAIVRKQEAIRQLFSVDGLSLEWMPDNGAPPMKCNPTITDIQFQEDIWFYQCKYTISFEAPILYINGTSVGENSFPEYITEANESWSVENNEVAQNIDKTLQRTYRMTHTVSATGKRFYSPDGSLSKEAWEQAKDWVDPKLGYDQNYADNDALGLSGFTGYNYVRSNSIGLTDGTYTVSETWILAKDTALEEFNVETRTSFDNSLTNVSITGTITGLEILNSSMVITTSKYENALNKYNSIKSSIITRAQSYSGLTLNIIPLNSSVAYNEINGIITYSYEYDNRPSNLISTAKSEAITITDNLNTDVIAIVPVLGRVVGPVLQNINTSRERTRTLNIEIVLTAAPTNSFTNPLIGSLLDPIIGQVNPSNAFGAGQCYLVENSTNWDVKTNRGSVTKVWVYEI